MSFPVAKLGDIAEIVSGSTPRTGTSEYWDGDIPWVTPADLSRLDGHYIADTPRKLTASGLANSGAKLLPVGSVLFSSRAPIGHVAVTSTAMATNQGFKSFVVDKSVIDAKYLFWWLRSNKRYLQGLGVGATFKEVSKAIVAGVRIPLPPLPEQRRIAAILDQADELRAKRRRALALLDELADAVYIDMFTEDHESWPMVPLAEIVEPGDRINYGIVQPGDAVLGGTPFVRVGDIRDGRIDQSNLKCISRTVEERYVRSRLKGNEILVTCVGSIGNVAIVDRQSIGLNIARAVARIPVIEGFSRIYLAAALRSPAVQAFFTSELRTVSQPTLNIKQLSEALVPRPPAMVQAAFSDRLTWVAQMRAAHRTHLANLDELFASLQHGAFN